MLYKLNKEENSIEMMPFFDFEHLSKKEKDLVIASAIVKNEEKKKEQACILKNVNGGFDV